MENSTRRHATVQLALSLFVFFTFALVVLPACNDDATVETVKQKASPKSDANGTVIDENGIPSMINGKKVKSVQQVEGGIKPYDGDDPTGDGEKEAIKAITAEFVGFAGISPCEVVQTQDLNGWPGGIGQASSERSNLGEIVVGCITKFQANGRNVGTISVYFSDNNTPELAADAVLAMPKTSPNAKVITDWEKPAVYDPTTMEFVWSHNQVFITLIIAHPSVMKDNLKWSKKLASAIESRMP
jgi:hypothetical protein